MLHDFLDANRTALVERCRARAARRLAPRPVPDGLAHGVPVFLGQLIETLRVEHRPGAPEGLKAAAAFGATGFRIETEIGASAAKHGHDLLLHRFTVGEIVHEYADLVQAIVELAIELKEPVSRDAFGTLGRCVDHAIASAASEFCRQRDRLGAVADHRALGERLALLTQDLRGLINTAMLAFVAIKEGGVGLHGATSAVLERSLVGLNDLMEHALRDVRVDMGAPARIDPVAVELFMAEAKVAGSLEARSRGCELDVSPVEPGLVMEADTQMLHSAVFGLVQNALRYTRPQGRIWLTAHATAERVLIEVEDQCGGLREEKPALPFPPFMSANRSGPGYGLSISRRAVEAMGGTLRFVDLPGVGCVSTIDLPRRAT
jgi:signal transduction histidine kinase